MLKLLWRQFFEQGFFNSEKNAVQAAIWTNCCACYLVTSIY